MADVLSTETGSRWEPFDDTEFAILFYGVFYDFGSGKRHWPDALPTPEGDLMDDMKTERDRRGLDDRAILKLVADAV